MAATYRFQDPEIVRSHPPSSTELNRVFVRVVSPLAGTSAVLDIPQTKKPSLHAGTIVSVHAHGLRFRVDVPVSQERMAPLTPGYTVFVAWTDLWASERRTLVQEGQLLEAVHRAHEIIAHSPPPANPLRALLGSRN